MAKKGRILSGHRPTGLLHIGHYEGTLRSWAALQDEYDCFFEIADWHALTTGYQETQSLPERSEQIAIDWLASGLDPERSTLFVQSQVPEHAELCLLLGMVTPVSWLERCPTYKDQIANLTDGAGPGLGLLGYPVLQAADIIMYKATVVPVGEDQLPHLELTREIVRRFNNLFGEVFPEPDAMLSEFAMVPGVDGRKMSKSYDNAINLADSIDEVAQKMKSMFTDPEKIRMGDAGHPDRCPVFVYHRMYNDPARVDEIKVQCEAGDLGCVDCKLEATERLLESLRPVMERRRELAANLDYVHQVLRDGARKARAVAAETMAEVRAAMSLDWMEQG
ncbi:MAG: tryptophan--tRNA ligase [Armatimonadota bacterium]